MKNRFKFSSAIVFCLSLGLMGCFDANFTESPTCFMPGTEISTPEGPVVIEELKRGQTVYSYSETSSALAESIVTKIIIRQVTEYLEFAFNNGKILRVTAEHPIAVRETNGSISWVAAGDLQDTHQIVVLSDNKKISQAAIESIQTIEGEFTVYNLKVENYKNSFAEGVLSHFYFQPD